MLGGTTHQADPFFKTNAPAYSLSNSFIARMPLILTDVRTSITIRLDKSAQKQVLKTYP